MFFILQSTDFKVQNVEGEKEREREKIFEYWWIFIPILATLVANIGMNIHVIIEMCSCYQFINSTPFL
jgi:hypothetical protein